MRPPTLPPAERFAHGARARYVTGCRCAPCTTANKLYARVRALAKVRGNWNGLVPADRARAHLLALRKAGIGKRSIAAACDVPASIIFGLTNGSRPRCRVSTERRILAVDGAARADGSRVRAGPTWAAVRELQRLGWTKAAISLALGSKTPQLQLRPRWVLARTALAVEQLLRRVKSTIGTCRRCGQSHADDPTAASWCAENPNAPIEAFERMEGSAA